MTYQLTDEDLDVAPEWDSAPVRAARNPNPAVLEALMAHYHDGLSRWNKLPKQYQRILMYYAPNEGVSGELWGNYESSLMAAIRFNSQRNVNLLLKSGGDVNGISSSDCRTTLFGGCPLRAQVLATARSKGINSQTSPLTSAELEERRIGFPRFWTEPNVPAQRLRMSMALTSLEVAAQCGCGEIFDILHKAGAEDSAWREPILPQQEIQLEVPIEAPISVLSLSSPVHQAIASGHRDMLKKLLNEYNYCPIPPSSGSDSRSPPSIFRNCPLRSGKAGLFDVHPLHFATARHDPGLLAWIAASIPDGHNAAGQTALGHTLLHVAALPLNGNYATQNKPAVKRSIRCARTLDSRWLQHIRPSPRYVENPPSRPPYTRRDKPFKPVPMSEAENAAQLATIKLLLEWGGFDFRVQDIDGNTALHYLAATVNVSTEVLELVRAMDGGDEVWESSMNWCGFSPKQLIEN